MAQEHCGVQVGTFLSSASSSVAATALLTMAHPAISDCADGCCNLVLFSAAPGNGGSPRKQQVNKYRDNDVAVRHVAKFCAVHINLHLL